MNVSPVFQVIERLFENENGSITYYCPTDLFHYMLYFISVYLKRFREKPDYNYFIANIGLDSTGMALG